MKETTINAKIQEDENVEGVLNLEPLRGPNGYSAYELYVKNLSEGETPLTELEWLESISKINYYRQYKQTIITTEANTSIIPINIDIYNETCLLEVFLNGLRLDDTEYSVDNEKKQVVLINAIEKDQVVHLIVNKTIVATAKDFDLLKGTSTSGGTSNYSELSNKPSINNVELVGNKTLDDFGIFSGDYNDLDNKPTIPTIPTKISSFENDSGYINSYTETDPTVPSCVKSITANDIANWNTKSDFSGSYDDLTGKPTIPSKTSDLTNDSGYITEIPDTIASKEYVDNKIGSINTILSTLTEVSE